MKKEIIISLIIIFLVVIADVITSNITDNKINDMNNSLSKMKENIKETKSIKDNKKNEENESEEKSENNQNIDNKIILDVKNLKREWENDNNILSYYIEHEELEKVGTEISCLYNYIESNDINQALDSIARLEFTLDHISKKYDFELNNFF